MVAEEKAKEVTPSLDIVQSLVVVAEVLVEAVATRTTVGVLSLVLEVAQAQAQVLRMEDKAGRGVVIPEVVEEMGAVVEPQGQAGEPTAVTVRHGHMDAEMAAVQVPQENQESMAATAATAEHQVVAAAVPQAKVTEALTEEATEGTEPEAKLEFIAGR